MQEKLNNLLDAFREIFPFVDNRYELKENYIECFTCDGDYIMQDVLEKLQEHLYYYGMTDEDGDSIDFTAERIYNG